MSSDYTSNFYSFWSTFYDYIFSNPPVIRQIRRKGVESLQLENGDTVVELGCGTGANFRYMEEEIGEEGKIIGVDPASGMLERAKKRKERNNWDNNIKLIQDDAKQVEIEEEIDAVLTSFSICVIGNPSEIIEKWSQELNGGRFGNIIISRTEKETILPINPLIDLFEYLTAPSTYNISKETPSIKEHEKLQKEGIKKLKELSKDFEISYHLFGTIKIYTGQIE